MTFLIFLKNSLPIVDTCQGTRGTNTRTFERPGDHCHLVQEVFEDGDCLLAVCKTDGDHMLGYNFNSLFCLARCNHQVNQWLHQIRKRAKNWLHMYFNAKYGEENRVKPPYFDSLPPTLTSTPFFKPTEEWLPLLKQYNNREGHGNSNAQP